MRNQRRTRYRFIATPPRRTEAQRIDVMAYSLPAALVILDDRGWSSVTDAPVERPVSGGGWQLNPRALREAVEFLGINHPVKVKQTGHQGGRRGAHSLRRDSRGQVYSHITIKSWLDPAQAGKTLWHELAHAMQASQAIDRYPERDPLKAWGAVRANGRGVTYRSKPIEVEARSYESFNVEKPLARPV